MVIKRSNSFDHTTGSLHNKRAKLTDSNEIKQDDIKSDDDNNDSEYGFKNENKEEINTELDDASRKITKFIKRKIEYFKSLEPEDLRQNERTIEFETHYKLDNNGRKRCYLHFVSPVSSKVENNIKYKRKIFNISGDFKTIDHPRGGANKILIAKNHGHRETLILLETKKEKTSTPIFTTYEIQKILYENGIQNYFALTFPQAGENFRIHLTHSAGDNDLDYFRPIDNSQKISVALFFNLIYAMEKLHAANRFLLDIKSGNIVVECNKEGIPQKLTFIDVRDSFSSSEDKKHKATAGTRGFTNLLLRKMAMHQKCNNENRAIIFAISDIYSLILTILLVTGFYKFHNLGTEDECYKALIKGGALDRASSYSGENKAIAEINDAQNRQSVEQFMQIYIKPEHHESFIALIEDPYLYAIRHITTETKKPTEPLTRLSSMFIGFDDVMNNQHPFQEHTAQLGNLDGEETKNWTQDF